MPKYTSRYEKYYSKLLLIYTNLSLNRVFQKGQIVKNV